MDVVGFSAGGDALVMGDCLWTDTPPGPEAVESLLRRATHALPRKDEDGDPTPVYFVAFSRAPGRPTPATRPRNCWTRPRSKTKNAGSRWASACSIWRLSTATWPNGRSRRNMPGKMTTNFQN